MGWLDTITHLSNAKKNVARVAIPMPVSSGQGSTGVGMNMHNMENMARHRDAYAVEPMSEDTGIMCIESYQLGFLASATATPTATTSFHLIQDVGKIINPVPCPMGWLEIRTHLSNAKKDVAKVAIPMPVSSGQDNAGVGMNMHNMENMAGRRDVNAMDLMSEDTGIVCINPNLI